MTSEEIKLLILRLELLVRIDELERENTDLKIVLTDILRRMK